MILCLLLLLFWLVIFLGEIGIFWSRSLFSLGGNIGRYQFLTFFLFASIYADANSVNVTPPQDTPISHRKDGKFIIFGIDVEIQKPIEKLPRGTDIDGIDLAWISQDCYLFRTQLSLFP